MIPLVDVDLRVGLAINNHVMLERLGPGNIEVILLGKAIVPATVPGRESVSIFLPGAGKSCASQRLHIDVPVGIRVGGEVRLRLNARARCRKDRHRNC